ncbi:hypothetical protein [Mangrovibrevibacter kandeliae]|uniref:hypothetical protein n=1 Tax=Mangrovibrevibacter kandeliae TaxID=2968473 RepID=UPI002118D7FC|nr:MULTISPECIES: hypothetical protein [unclassified Aurantimonas]MCQ8782636.1 hypothetical protein [Aurantimonas sp. CSK15Z-1]MCW4114555.1 hypothetical protein [Aurantimonas sp. MSK8Z-1]
MTSRRILLSAFVSYALAGTPLARDLHGNGPHHYRLTRASRLLPPCDPLVLARDIP